MKLNKKQCLSSLEFCYATDNHEDDEDYYTRVPQELVENLIYLLKLPEGTTEWVRISPNDIYECRVCGQTVMTEDIDAYKYCHGCGRTALRRTI